MRLFNIDLSQLRGILDKAIGLNKEFLGTLFGNENLAEEGQSPAGPGHRLSSRRSGPR